MPLLVVESAALQGEVVLHCRNMMAVEANTSGIVGSWVRSAQGESLLGLQAWQLVLKRLF